jgi:hypothetical protein
VKGKVEELLQEPARAKIQSDCDAIIQQLSGKDTSKDAASEILKLIPQS